MTLTSDVREGPRRGGDPREAAGAATAGAAALPLDSFEVRTCRAAQGCPRAVADVVSARDECMNALQGMDADSLLRAKAHGPFREHHRLKVAISGCPNQCSQPQIADVGLVGQRVPTVDLEQCIACGLCVETCGEGAYALGGGGLVFDRERCVGCGECIAVCPTGALSAAEEGWRVLAGGRLGRHPRLAAEVESCGSLTRAVSLLEGVLDVFAKSGAEGERVGATLDRLAGEAGFDPAAAAVVQAAGPIEEEERRRARAIACVLDRSGRAL